MKCKYCPSDEELMWPENWKKGDPPLNAETGQPHDCREFKKKAEKPDIPIKYYCYECDNVNTFCEDLNCVKCKTTPGFCPVCKTHPQVINAR